MPIASSLTPSVLNCCSPLLCSPFTRHCFVCPRARCGAVGVLLVPVLLLLVLVLSEVLMPVLMLVLVLVLVLSQYQESPRYAVHCGDHCDLSLVHRALLELGFPRWEWSVWWIV